MNGRTRRRERTPYTDEHCTAPGCARRLTLTEAWTHDDDAKLCGPHRAARTRQANRGQA